MNVFLFDMSAFINLFHKVGFKGHALDYNPQRILLNLRNKVVITSKITNYFYCMYSETNV